MIHINRKHIKEPNILKDSDETKEAITHFTDAKKMTETFEFKLYKSVRFDLEKIFVGKCVYCESKYLSVYTGDIEHFRPKAAYNKAGKTKTTDIKPGYYWLAADWDNLLMSCRHCNQKKTHKLSNGGELVTGKGTNFPLFLKKGEEDVDVRCSVHNNAVRFELEESRRLLINPCIDSPEDMIDYDTDYDIMPKKDLGDYKSEMVKTSVKTYGLHRYDLVISRKLHAKKVKLQLLRIEEYAVDFANLDGEDRKSYIAIQHRLRRELRILKDMTLDKSEYAGLTRHIIKNENPNLKLE